MSLFSKLFRSDERPAWARQGPAADYRAFVEGVEGLFNQWNVDIEPHFDEGFIRLSGTSYELGMDNVWRRFLGADPEDRAEVLEDHFSTIMEQVRSRRESVITDLREQLRIRIYPRDYVEHFGAAAPEFVWSEFSPGSVLVLVADFDRGAQACRKTDLEHAELGEEEAWRLAQANTFAKEPFIVERGQIEALPVFTLITGSIYASSAILDLQRYLIPQPEHPVFVCIPAGGLLGWLESPPEQEPAVLDFLSRFTQYAIQREDMPLTQELFRWHEGRVDVVDRA